MGGAVSAPSEATEVTGDEAVSPPATEAGAPPATTEQAPGGETTQTSEGGEQPSEIKATPEQLAAIVERFGDQLKEVPQFQGIVAEQLQSLTQQAAEAASTDFALDREWNELTQEFDGLGSQLDDATKDAKEKSERAAGLLDLFNKGDERVTVPHVAQATLQALQAAEKRAELAGERSGKAELRSDRAQFYTLDGVANSLLGPDAGLEITLGGKKGTVDQAYANALETFHRFRNAGVNLEKAGRPLGDAEVNARKRALPTFVESMLSIAMAVGEAKALDKAAKKDARTTAADEELRKSNLLQEMLADGTLPGTATAPKGGSALSSDQIIADYNAGKITDAQMREHEKAGRVKLKF